MNAKTVLKTLIASLLIAATPTGLAHATIQYFDMDDPAYYQESGNVYYGAECTDLTWRLAVPGPSQASAAIHGTLFNGNFEQVQHLGMRGIRDDDYSNVCGIGTPFVSDILTASSYQGTLNAVVPTTVIVTWRPITLANWGLQNSAYLHGDCLLQIDGMASFTPAYNGATGECNFTVLSFTGTANFGVKVVAHANNPDYASALANPPPATILASLTIQAVTNIAHAETIVAGITP